MEINKIYCGNSLNVLKTFEDNSIDSVVTDPPYGISFMNKRWDYDVPGVDVWKEVLRVLKPGGHGLVACGTRTQHRMAVNLEDAGFEIRDLIAWIYGSGFPKSLNIGKAIDKINGCKREVIGTYQDVYKHDNAIRTSETIESQRPFHGDNTKGNTNPYKLEVSIGTSEFEGWGTTLKPAMELWTLVRKPLSEKTVAENVLMYGTGGINIDGCRVEMSQYDKEEYIPNRVGYKDGINHKQLNGKDNTDCYKLDANEGLKTEVFNPQGRFPTNVIHDGSDEVLRGFPETIGVEKRAKIIGRSVRGKGNVFGDYGKILYDGPAHPGSGSVSRFFYCAKASKRERNEGCNGLDLKEGSVLQGSKRGELNTNGLPPQTKNNHPTVKPLALMEYLVKLITPKGGTVLDPFTGSGTTLIAAVKLNFEYIGIELNEEYVKIAEARIKPYQSQIKLAL